jgi:hypothetical protein
MATTQVKTDLIEDGAVTSAKLDTNIAIDGNLTVDTNTLYVDSADNRVGIGTTTPNSKLEVNVGTDQNVAINSYNSIARISSYNDAFNASAPLIINGLDLRFNKNSEERMRIDSSGNVLVGLTSRVTGLSGFTQFEVSGAEGGITINSNTTTAGKYSRLLFTKSGATGNEGAIRYNVNNYSMEFWTNVNERMRIDSSGRVGIGVTPNAWSSPNFVALQLGVGASVAGRGSAGTGDQIYISANTYYDGTTWRYIETNPASNYYQDNGEHVWRTAVNGAAGVPTTFSERMRITNTGNVGIGTTSPATKLHISDTAAVFTTTSTNGVSGFIQNVIGGATALYRLQNDSSEKMRVTGGGNVLIGTTVDYSRLTVSNENSARTGITISDTNTSSLMLFAGNSSDAVIAIDTYNLAFKTGATAGQDNGTTRMLIQQGGNVGIGTTSPANTLNVEGDIGFAGYLGQGSIYGNTGNNSYGRVQLYDPATGYTTFNNIQYGYYFQTNSGTKMTILNNGNVGIGTASPAEKLHVVGNIKATGDVVADCSSDERLKDNINVINNPIDKIKKIKGVEFDWNDKQSTYEGHDIGVIAQDIEKVLPELVSTRDNGYKAVKYDKLTALLIEAVKQQQEQIEKLEKLILKQ